MRAFLLITSCFLMAPTLIGLNYNATLFSCSTNYLALTLRIDSGDNIEQFAYFDGKVSWIAEAVQRNNLEYTIYARGTNTLITDPNKELSTQLSFFLPTERLVTRVQVGGYYFPIIETHPFTFELAVVMTDEYGSQKTVYLDCVGT